MVSFPVSTKELEFFLPHREPMRWVDSIVQKFENGSGRSLCTLKKNSLILDGEKIFPSAFIELIGQTYGYLKGIEAKETNRKLETAYLAAVDEFTTHGSLPGVNDVLLIDVETIADIDPIYVVRGSVSCDGQNLAEARIKCFAQLSLSSRGDRK